MENFNLENVPPEQLERVLANIAAIKQQRAVENKLASYKPYDRQRQFHEAGTSHRERLLMAGNQLGKTLAGAMETAMHATGRYPEWSLTARSNFTTKLRTISYVIMLFVLTAIGVTVTLMFTMTLLWLWLLR